MNYIYDILLNFNIKMIDFFEWEKNDLILHIKKIPIYKIDIENFEKILTHHFIVNEEFLYNIYLKTEMWNNNKNKDDLYYSLFTDGNGVFAAKFDKYGKCMERSSLYIDEELEVLEICERLSLKKVNFELKNKINSNFKTRKEKNTENFLLEKLDELKNNNDYNKIKYLYFECFNKNENDINKALIKIKDIIEKNYNDKNKELFNFFKLISINNK